MPNKQCSFIFWRRKLKLMSSTGRSTYSNSLENKTFFNLPKQLFRVIIILLFVSCTFNDIQTLFFLFMPGLNVTADERVFISGNIAEASEKPHSVLLRKQNIAFAILSLALLVLIFIIIPACVLVIPYYLITTVIGILLYKIFRQITFASKFSNNRFIKIFFKVMQRIFLLTLLALFLGYFYWLFNSEENFASDTFILLISAGLLYGNVLFKFINDTDDEPLFDGEFGDIFIANSGRPKLFPCASLLTLLYWIYGKVGPWAVQFLPV